MKYITLFVRHKKIALLVASIITGIVIIGGSFWSIDNRNEEVITPNIDKSSDNGTSGNDAGVIREYDYTKAPDHIGERATISGIVVKVFTAKSGVTFLDFCKNIDSCPFSGIIFASDLKRFTDVQDYTGAVKITGVIKSYKGRAEIIVSDPAQVLM